MNCPSCGIIIESKWIFCPKCANRLDLSNTTPRPKKVIKTVEVNIDVKFCELCKRNVRPVKHKPAQLSWFAIILLTIVTLGMFPVIYIAGRFITSLVGKPNTCPICNSTL